MTTTFHHNNDTPNQPLSIPHKETSDLLDDFLRTSASDVQFAFPPPDLMSLSSSSHSTSSVARYEHQEERHRGAREHSIALVPFCAKKEHPHHATVSSLVGVSASVAPCCSSLTTSPLHKVIRIPRSNNPFGADAIHPKKKSMKKQRKRKTAAGAVGGMVVGGLALGPAGVFLGAAAGAVATNKICKARERRAQRKYEQENFQQGAEQSNVHRATFA